MAKLSLRNVYKVYEGGVRAVSDFNLDIDDKEFVVFVGPSGCGKSTTLRMIAGLEEITSGDLYIDGVKVNDVEPKDRNIAMVFQNYALYPHMTVYKNMGFGLRLRKVPADEIDRRVRRAAEILGISDLLARKPKALSGGQRQRVALGRAIVREPNVFLLDEPLSNLDAKLRVAMRSEIIKLHKRLATTFVYVTHDQTEAMTMGDRIVVMKDGFIQQTDSPATLYEQPRNVFVATFLGSPQMNVFKARLEREGEKLFVAFGNGFKAEFPEIKAKQLSSVELIGGEVNFGIRPENIALTADGNAIPAVIDVVEHLGSETIVYAAVEGLESNIVVKTASDHSLVAGLKIALSFDMKNAHVFSVETGRAVMGVPEYNVLDCSLSGGRISFCGNDTELSEHLKERLFDFAERDCAKLYIPTDAVSLTEIPDSFEFDGKVEFTVSGSDSVSVFARIGGDERFVVRVKAADCKAGDKIRFFVPFRSISLISRDGVRLNGKEPVSENTAKCSVRTAGGVSMVKVGASTLKFDDLGVPDGEYMMKLSADKLGFCYDKKYARKNKLSLDDARGNVFVAKAYDEDKLGGGKNATYLSVGGFDNYVTAVLPDEFSVYKMPVFGLKISKDSFTLTKAD